jgi:DNA-binding NarL/FixJ family response regulator
MLGLLRTADDVARRARLSVAGDSSRESATGGALTAREREVLELVRQGLSNRQIGQRLFISDKTASVHVSAILRKLGAKSRAEAAGRADGVLNRSRETST